MGRRHRNWFRVDQDINDNAKLWHLTDTHGDRGLRVVLEIFALIEKTKNRWRVNSDSLMAVSRKCRNSPAKVWRIARGLVENRSLWVRECAMDGSWCILGASNYAEFHNTEVQAGSPVFTLNLPSFLKNYKENKEVQIETEKSTAVARVIGRINELSGKAFKNESERTNHHLSARLEEGHSAEECVAVVENRWARWKDEEQMREYFNPVTLFRPTNFERYLIEAKAQKGNSEDKWERAAKRLEERRQREKEHTGDGEATGGLPRKEPA